MSDGMDPDNLKLASLGNLKINRFIRTMRETHGEDKLDQIMDGLLIAAFIYYAHDVGYLNQIEVLLWFWQRRLHPEEALRSVETEGSA